MNRKQKITLSITGIILVTLILVGLTYGYYLTTIKGNTNTKSITTSLANLELKYDDGNGIITSSNLEPGDSVTKTFSVENTGNKKVVNYTVYLENVINEFIDKNDLKITLKCTSNNGTCNGNTLTYPSSDGIIAVNDIEEKEIQTFELKVDFIETNDLQNDNMNKKFEGNVKILDIKSINKKLVTSEGENNATVSSPELLTNFKIYGNSLQETRSGKNLIDNSMSSNNSIKNESEVNMWATTVFDNQTVTSNLKSDTTYTISYDVQCVSLPEHDGEYSGGSYYGLLLYSGVNGNNLVDFRNVGFLKAGETVHISKSFSTPSTLNESTANYKILGYTNLYTLNGSYKQNEKNITSNMIFKNIQIEEGNKETSYEKSGVSPSPNYPSEISSVGDLVTDTSNSNYGKYKLTVKTTGKNLLNISAIGTDDKITNIENGKITITNSYYTLLVNSSGSALHLKELCPELQVGDTFVFNSTTTNLNRLYLGTMKQTIDANTSYICTQEMLDSTVAIYGKADETVVVSDLQLEKGSTSSEYEPYEKTQTDIYLDEPLRKVGEYSDYIDLVNKKIVRNIKVGILDGSEGWNLAGTTTKDYQSFYTKKYKDKVLFGSRSCLSNKFTNVNNSLWIATKSYLIQTGLNDGVCYASFPKNVADDVTKVKTFFKNNNTIYQFILNESIIESINIPEIELTSNTKNISIKTSTKPSNIEIGYIS